MVWRYYNENIRKNQQENQCCAYSMSQKGLDLEPKSLYEYQLDILWNRKISGAGTARGEITLNPMSVWSRTLIVNVVEKERLPKKYTACYH